MILLQPNDAGADIRISLCPHSEPHRLFHVGGHADQRTVVLEVPCPATGGIQKELAEGVGQNFG